MLLSIRVQGYDLEMEADSATSAPAKRISRELEIYCYFLMLLFLIDQNRYNEVMLFFLLLMSLSVYLGVES